VKISIDQIMEAVEADDNIGLCTASGAEHYGIEPDARKYTCEECGENSVYGAQELLMRLG
jgi:hypothetical protein